MIHNQPYLSAKGIKSTVDTLNMASKLIIVFAVLAISQAVPIWREHVEYVPGVYLRTGRAPNVAFGFGSGFSSNIGGISHSTGISSAYQSGDAQAYGAGLGGANGNVFARGIGYANAAPSYPFNHPQAIASTFNNGLGRNYGSAVSSAQNFGNIGSAVSSAQSFGGHGSAVSAVHNNGLARFQTAVSSAQNLGYGSAVSSATNGLGYGSAVSSSQNAGPYRTALSSVHGHNGINDYGTAVSAAQNIGGYRASTAQTSQQRGFSYQNSGASSIDGPGIQAAQSHAVNTGNY